MNKTILYRPESIKTLLTQAQAETKVGFDIESAGREPDAVIAGFSVYLPSQQVAAYIPLNHQPQHNHPSYPPPPRETVREYAELLSALPLVTFNGSFDLGRMEMATGVRLRAVGDADLVVKILQLHKQYTGLKALALEMALTPTTIEIEDILGPNNYDFTQAPLDDKTLDYTTQDAILAVQVEEAILTQELNREKYPDFDKVYALELKIMPILGVPELQGLAIDLDKFEKAARQLQMEFDDLTEEICQELGRNSDDFKIGSDQQLSCALFNKPDRVPQPLPPMKPRQRKAPVQDQRDLPGLGLQPMIKGTKKGPKLEYDYYSVATLELQRITDQHPIIHKILKWKNLDYVINNDVQHVDEWVLNGRIYPRFLQVGKDATSRIYTGKPNVISMSKTVREAFVPDPGKVFVHLDYDAAEWRIVAHLAGETKILEALDRGEDPHKATFSFMSSTPLDQVTKEQREVGKILNYAALYGSTGYSLARSLKCDEKEATHQQQKFWETYPNLRKWCDERIEYARKHLRTHTILGRVRKLDYAIKGKADRRSINTAVQGSCGDALKLSILEVDRAIKDPNNLLNKYHCRIVCPVYDALLIEMDIEALQEKDTAEKAIRDAFEVVLTTDSRSTRMGAGIGWSTENWRQAMGK